MELRKETRLVVVDEKGRFYDKSNITIHENKQDDNKTLKLFIKTK